VNRTILFLAAGLALLAAAGCSFNLALPTPFPTTPYPPLVTPSVPATAASLASPTAAAVPVTGLPTPSTTPTASLPTALPATPTTAPSPADSLPLSATPGPQYAVVLVGTGDSLNIRSGPGAANALIGSFPAGTANVIRTGPSTQADGETWVQVQAPSGGTGWVAARFLTEFVPQATFCADGRVNALLTGLANAVTASDGSALAGLVSAAHGMDVRLYRDGKAVNYDREHAAFVFGSSYQVDWGAAPGSGQPTVGSFHQAVLPGLQEVFNASYTLSCDSIEIGAASYTPSWPVEYTPINYYSIYKPGPAGNELSWRTLLVGVEYVAGQPALFSLTQLAWEP